MRGCPVPLAESGDVHLDYWVIGQIYSYDDTILGGYSSAPFP